MRYSHIFHPPPPSPSDAGLIKAKAGPLGAQKVPRRLPTSRHHSLRKSSLSTASTASRSNSVERGPAAGGEAAPGAKERKKTPLRSAPAHDAIPEADDDDDGDDDGDGEDGLPPARPVRPRLAAWESYLHWLCLTEDPGTLWSSSLCAAFGECLRAGGDDDDDDDDDEEEEEEEEGASGAGRAGACARRVDDIYWSFYLPLDPLLSFMEDRILSGYLLHVWTMFIELGKRIPHDDPAQDRLVGLLKELVHLPPMEVRTWEGNDAPWTDLPTLDDALMAAWDDLYDPEIRMADPEGQWVNYFAFLGRLVAADVTPDWFEIPAVTLKEVLVEDVEPTYLTAYKTMALAEFLNQAGDGFMDWCVESGTLDARKNMDIVAPLLKSPVRQDWFQKGRGTGDRSATRLQARGRKRAAV